MVRWFESIPFHTILETILNDAESRAHAESREFAEDQANEHVAWVYNWTFNKEKSWEESYKEALIQQTQQYFKLWNEFLDTNPDIIRTHNMKVVIKSRKYDTNGKLIQVIFTDENALHQCSYSAKYIDGNLVNSNWSIIGENEDLLDEAKALYGEDCALVTPYR